MGALSDDAIRDRAYQIWEREGRPHGHDFEHWVRAQVELIAETSTDTSGSKAAAARARGANSKAGLPNASAKSAVPKIVRSVASTRRPRQEARVRPISRRCGRVGCAGRNALRLPERHRRSVRLAVPRSWLQRGQKRSQPARVSAGTAGPSTLLFPEPLLPWFQPRHQARGVPAAAAHGLHLGVELVHQRRDRQAAHRCGAPRRKRWPDPCASSRRRSRTRSGPPASSGARFSICHDCAAPFAITSITAFASSPARRAKCSASASPSTRPAMQIWFTILASWPDPAGPSRFTMRA